MSAVGSFYLLRSALRAHARIFVRSGVVAGAIASVPIFPTGDGNATVFAHQPTRVPPWKACSRPNGAPMVYLVGQPNLETMTIDNPIEIPTALSFLVYGDSTLR